jgi:hypothetical protein
MRLSSERDSIRFTNDKFANSRTTLKNRAKRTNGDTASSFRMPQYEYRMGPLPASYFFTDRPEGA